jgi:mono/diheme cytochrome c family protein
MTRRRKTVAAATAFQGASRIFIVGGVRVSTSTQRRLEVTHQCAVQTGKAWLAVLLAAGFAVVVALPAGSQNQPNSNVEVRKVPVSPNNTVDGASLYRNYCATCHGPGGKGNGPAAAALKTPPPDLTVLAKNNKGKFPDLKVQYILENGTDLAAHGSKDMPVWGPIFRSMGADYLRHQREVNLATYLKSIQGKRAR